MPRWPDAAGAVSRYPAGAPGAARRWSGRGGAPAARGAAEPSAAGPAADAATRPGTPSAGWWAAGWARGGALDRRCAIALHRVAARPLALRLLRLCSRLADGPLWVSLPVLLPLLDGASGLHWALLVLVTGSVDLLIYWAVKRGTRRPRPFHQHPGVIHARAKAPDLFSFPSGHTLHAVAFALLLSAAYPALAPLLWILAALVGTARVVLGLHYPSDVLAGALIGAATAGGVLAVFGRTATRFGGLLLH